MILTDRNRPCTLSIVINIASVTSHKNGGGGGGGGQNSRSHSHPPAATSSVIGEMCQADNTVIFTIVGTTSLKHCCYYNNCC